MERGAKEKVREGEEKSAKGLNKRERVKKKTTKKDGSNVWVDERPKRKSRG